MPSSPYYPLDTTGSASTNLVGSPNFETHTITAAQGPDINFIIPHAAPFFAQNLQVVRISGATVTPLVEGVDYMLLMKFIAATMSTGKPIYGGIGMISTNFSGTVGVRYQTLGGDWVLDSHNIILDLLETVHNVRTVSWGQVAGYPTVFPPGPHSQPITDFMGWESVVEKLVDIEDAILQASENVNLGVGAILNQHLTGLASHTKDQVGLGLVTNAGFATPEQAVAGVSGSVYMNPARTVQLMAYFNAGTATKLRNTRNIELTGVIQGNANFDGSGNITITTSYVAGPSGVSWSTLSGVPEDLKSGKLDISRIPNLPANLVTSGEFEVARIPTLPANRVTSGTFDADRIPVLTPTHIPAIPPSKLNAPVPLDIGGTGATSAAQARTNLGLGSIAGYQLYIGAESSPPADPTNTIWLIPE